MLASLTEMDGAEMYVIHEMETPCWRFDWPAFLRALGNRPDKSSPSHTYTVRHSTSVRETALHGAVVRSCHFRLAPFRLRFQNTRSVLPQA